MAVTETAGHMLFHCNLCWGTLRRGQPMHDACQSIGAAHVESINFFGLAKLYQRVGDQSSTRVLIGVCVHRKAVLREYVFGDEVVSCARTEISVDFNAALCCGIH